MKIKHIINNDTSRPMRVRVVDQSDTPWEGRLCVLGPQTMKQFELDIPDDSVIYYKQWDSGIVFLSYAEPLIDSE